MRLRRLLWLAIALALLLTTALLSTPGSSLDSSGVYLNMVFNHYPPYPLVLTSAWTADEAGTPATDFSAGETIQYHASGSNSGERTIDIDLSWSLDNYCGETLVYTDTLTIAPGDWTAVYTQTVPVCSGVSNYTLQASFSERVQVAAAQFGVTNPVAPAAWAKPAFDTCDDATISMMQTWWTSSPYWSMNIYIGGIHRLCVNPYMTPEWVTAVMDQGWALIPTWVGPQAPCTDFWHTFSYDLTEAYQEGRAEAGMAMLAAAELGLTSYGTNSTIIYYDLEGYASDVTPGCREAAKSFVNGWVERMHELGSPAGMYGGAGSSYISDWATIPNVPDDVWLAAWYTDYYDPLATVWVPKYLSDDLWADHQRLRQYAGDHSETWGGLTFKDIDSDVTDGVVLARAATLQAVDAARAQRPPLVSGPSVESIGALSAQQAWVLLDGRLYWTADGVVSWTDIGPGEVSIQAATFLDAEHGWLVSGPTAEEPGFTFWQTADSGQSWQATPLVAPNLIPPDARAAALDFTSPQEGWLALKLAGSANFNRGMLFHTGDGGLTWEQRSLPGGGMIDFANATLGWTLAGALGDELYQTQDGGWTWHQVSSATEAPLPLQNPLQSSLPAAEEIFYVDTSTAWAFTRAGECNRQSCTSSSLLWRTLDGGGTWTQVALPVPLVGSFGTTH